MIFSVKDYLYTAVITALLIAFGWYTVHEREAGAAHELAAVEASTQKLQAQTAKQTADLQARATLAEQSYAKEQADNQNYRDSHPIQPVRLCVNANRSAVVPAASAKKPGDATAGATAGNIQPMPSGDSAGPDISGLLDALAAAADRVNSRLREYQARVQ